MPDLIANIPFSGFYESAWSHMVDREEEQYAENFADDRQAEEDVPDELRLNVGEVLSILFDVTDYSDAFAAIARGYAAAFDEWAGAELGFDLGLHFESMSSPREYNFATDRIFVHMPEETAARLFALSEADNHKHLARVIAERFTSRSGFLSFYSNRLPEWLGEPVTDWDHNKLETLLLACLTAAGADWESAAGFGELYEAVDGYAAWEAAVDWEAFDKCVQAARDAKAEARPYRCRRTPDLFASKGV